MRLVCPKPLSIYVDTYGTAQVPEEAIERAVAQSMDLTPRGIREHLGLNSRYINGPQPMGTLAAQPEADGGFSWEKIDLVEALKKAV
jgi:S-adenosylmethionine synthetase